MLNVCDNLAIKKAFPHFPFEYKKHTAKCTHDETTWDEM